MTYQDICDIITDKSVDWLGEYYRTPMAGFGGYTLAALREHRKVIVELPEPDHVTEATDDENGRKEWWYPHGGRVTVFDDGEVHWGNWSSLRPQKLRQAGAALLAAAEKAQGGNEVSLKVTDLEKFALREVLRPFWPTLQDELMASDPFRSVYRVPVKQARYPDRLEHSIQEVADMLDVGPIGWRMDVFTRLHRMGVRFPDYVQHKLVVVVACGMNMAAATAAEADQ